jgi:transcriptional regulator with XRE-family HTH domain
VQLEHDSYPRLRLLDVTLRVEVYINLSLCGSVKRMGMGHTIAIDGQAVRHHRLYTACRGVSALAEEAGITRRYLHMIESGQQKRIRPEVLGRLRTALRVEAESLLAQPK